MINLTKERDVNLLRACTVSLIFISIYKDLVQSTTVAIDAVCSHFFSLLWRKGKYLRKLLAPVLTHLHRKVCEACSENAVKKT